MALWRTVRGPMALAVGYFLFHFVLFAEAVYSIPRGGNADCAGLVTLVLGRLLYLEPVRRFALGPCRHIDHLNLWLFLPAVLLLALGYLEMIRTVWRDPERWSLGRCIGAVLMATLPLLLLLPPASADYLAYIWAGRVASVYHLSPWHHTLAEFPKEQIYLSPQIWGPDLRCVYGPVCVAVMAVTAGISHLLSPGEFTLTGCMLNVVLLRVANAMAMVAAVAAVWQIQGHHPLRGYPAPRRRALVTALFALNPLLIFEMIGSLHNDIWGVALLLWACYLFLRGNALFIVLFGLSLLSKPFGLALVPMLGIYLLRRRSWTQLASLAGVVLLWMGVTRFTDPTYLVGRLDGGTSSFGISPTSLPQLLACLETFVRECDIRGTMRTIARVNTVLFLPLLALLVWRTRTREQVIQHGALAMLLYLGGAYLQTMGWYFVWPLALLCAMAWNRGTGNIIWGTTFLPLAYTMYYWHHNRATPSTLVISYLLGVALPAGIWLIGRWCRWRVCPFAEEPKAVESRTGKPGRRGAGPGGAKRRARTDREVVGARGSR